MDRGSGRLPDNLAQHAMASVPVRTVIPNHDGTRTVIDSSGIHLMPAAGSGTMFYGRPAAGPTMRETTGMRSFGSVGTAMPAPLLTSGQAYSGPESFSDRLPSYEGNALPFGPQRGREPHRKTQSLPRLWEVVGPKENLIVRPREPARQPSPPKLRLPLSPAPASRSNQPLSRKRKSGEFSKDTVAEPRPASTIRGLSDPLRAALPRLLGRAGSEPMLDWEEPAPKRAKQSTSGGSRSAAESKDSAEAAVLLDVSMISLPGEETKSVPVYDTCDMVRAKIEAFFAAHPCVTQAAFLRTLAQTWRDGRRLQGAQLNRFLNLSGPRAGNTSGVFYAAYVFFEKVRIRDGKPKSADRLEMERIYPDGMNTTDLQSYVTVMRGETVSEDRFGQLHFEGGERKAWKTERL